MTELHPEAELDEGYWESLGAQDSNRYVSLGQPPAADLDPFKDYGEPPRRGSRYEAPWLRTRKGIEFIDVFIGDLPDSDDTHATVFLFEVVPGKFNVGVCPPKSVEGGRFLAEGETYDSAKAKAERAAAAMSVDAGLNADWRSSPPSLTQLGLIERIYLSNREPVPSNIASKGEASDILSTLFISRVLDPAFA